jgi:hypothetical protein
MIKIARIWKGSHKPKARAKKTYNYWINQTEYGDSLRAWRWQRG